MTTRKAVRKLERPRSPASANEENKFTLAESFTYDVNQAGDLENEKAVRSCAFLLQYLSEIGNEQPDSWAAYGIGCVLDGVAERIASASLTRRQLGEEVLG